MNELHLQLLTTPEWRKYVEQELLPWALDGRDLGDDVLEVGPGPGLTTDVLRSHVARVTAVEVDAELTATLADRLANTNVTVVCADASHSGLPPGGFSAATCFTMLHHMPTPAHQDALFAEVFRLLRPGGVFVGTDAIDTPDLRALHVDDTFVPVDPDTLAARLAAPGFQHITVQQIDDRVHFAAHKPASPPGSNDMNAPTPRPVGDFTLIWGESLRWDEQRQRLYFVDCGTQRLHWLDDGAPPLRTLQLASLPTGVVLTDDGQLVVALDDGLNLINPDTGTIDLLAPYPAGLGGRANDAAADLDGNLVTGTLNLAAGTGSYWWYSAAAGWRQLDDDISNANGPAVLTLDDRLTLVCADTPAAAIYAYDYDGATGHASNRRLFADTSEFGGIPDGACVDDRAGVWSCLLKAGLLVRYTPTGSTDRIDATVALPSDVTFGGADLDRMYFVSIAVDLDDYTPLTGANVGRLMVIDQPGYGGRLEPRFRL